MSREKDRNRWRKRKCSGHVHYMAPLMEVRQDPGNQAKEEEEDVDGMFAWVD